MAYCYLSANKPSKKVLQELKRVKLKSILTKGQEIVIDFALPNITMKEKVRPLRKTLVYHPCVCHFSLLAQPLFYFLNSLHVCLNKYCIIGN